MKVLVTGGAGYVGSVVCSALTDGGHTPVVLDSLVTGRDEFIRDKIFYMGDMGDGGLIRHIFDEHPDIELLIHSAELADVEKSVTDPYSYYHTNVVKSFELFGAVMKAGLKKIIYSSSGCLYDDIPGYVVTETSRVNPRSPYARSKYTAELILQDFAAAYNVKSIILRYFNPIGADPVLRSGIQPKNPDSIIRALTRVVNADDPSFIIRGNNWGTRDGTCIRDYIHVWDLAKAYLHAVERFDEAIENNPDETSCLVINIGSGRGVTVREFVYAFENATHEQINCTYAEARPGDVAGSYANISRAKKLLGWEAQLPLEEAILDSVRWEAKRLSEI